MNRESCNSIPARIASFASFSFVRRKVVERQLRIPLNERKEKKEEEEETIGEGWGWGETFNPAEPRVLPIVLFVDKFVIFVLN